MKRVKLEAGTLIGFKIIPGSAVDEGTFSGQTDNDWSAIYVQFDVDRAIRYLSNHFDRGHKEASLVSIINNVPMEALVLDDARLKDPHISAPFKAEILRTSLPQLGTPLMGDFGKKLPNTILVTFDSDLFEIIIPHCLVETEGKFKTEILATFTADPVRTWSLSRCLLAGQEVNLDRDSRESCKYLAKTIHDKIRPNHATWSDELEDF